MHKFIAIVKREYLTRVRTRMFIISTVLMPVMSMMWGVVPGLLMSTRSGGPTRVVVVDMSGRMYDALQDHIQFKKVEQEQPDGLVAAEQQAKETPAQRMTNTARKVPTDFTMAKIEISGRAIDQIRADLLESAKLKAIDAFIIVPVDATRGEGFELYLRKSNDIFTREQLKRNINEAVRDIRLRDANITTAQLDAAAVPVKFTQSGTQEGSGEGPAGFFVVLILGVLMYVVLIMYGQVIMAAVIEEKETRIAEILFASVSSFHLILGKLVGISLVAMTQLAIWLSAGLLLVSQLSGSASVPVVSWTVLPLLLLFFLVGYFVYASLYALIGSMVTTPQEASQFSFPVTILLILSFTTAFAVIRNPESLVSTIISMVPFSAPIVMPIRIVTHSAPAWQIALSALICAVTAALCVWIAARVYRVGMLMYGKRATLPEIARWIRQR